jgi:sugar phosphate isomerase/epimerase
MIAEYKIHEVTCYIAVSLLPPAHSYHHPYDYDEYDDTKKYSGIEPRFKDTTYQFAGSHGNQQQQQCGKRQVQLFHVVCFFILSKTSCQWHNDDYINADSLNPKDYTIFLLQTASPVIRRYQFKTKAMKLLQRRSFLTAMMGLPAMSFNGLQVPEEHLSFPTKRLKTSLNAYSFNAPLMDGSMTIHDLIDFCASEGFDGVDITGYYFKGYPKVPDDKCLYEIKRKAFNEGITITGTGVRNDFTYADKNKRQKEVDHVKQWVEVAEKIGAPVIRIFAGTQKNEGVSKEKVTEWMLPELKSCIDFGGQHGVVIGLQNHNDFIQTAAQVNGIIEQINSPWFGLILDTGSYRVLNAYDEIQLSIKHAVNWQIKENIFIDGREVETDLERVMSIIHQSGYKGYLPIETLGKGDPKEKVRVLLAMLKRAMQTA